MSYAAIVLIGFGILALVLIVLFELAQILSEGGAKLLLWPRLNHGYEVAPVTRLAIAPWVLLLIIHLVDYQRSVIAAVAALLLLSVGAAYVLYVLHDWMWLPVVALFLLWALNGVRAVHADRVMG